MDMQKKTNILLGLYVLALTLSNVIGSKITQFELPRILAGFLDIVFFPVIWVFKLFLDTIGARTIQFAFFDTIHVSVGILTVPLMFLITDIIEEVYGRKKVGEFVLVGVVALLSMIGIVSIAVLLPTAERSIPQETFSSVFGVTIRMAIASVLAFVIAQVHDMWSFEFWKKKTKGKYLWLRNNLSTIPSQFIDTVIFMFVAFYKSAPGWDAVFVISLIVPYFIFKILFALIDTPFAYLGVRWLQGSKTSENSRETG